MARSGLARPGPMCGGAVQLGWRVFAEFLHAAVTSQFLVVVSMVSLCPVALEGLGPGMVGGRLGSG